MLILGASLAMLIAAGTLTEFPGGTIEIPPVCKAPSQAKWTHDVFSASIECEKDGLRILLWGDLYVADHCGPSPNIIGVPTRTDFYRITLVGGEVLTICTTEEKATESKRALKEMVIDMGPGRLIAEIKNPRHAYLLLQIATSFRSVKAPDRK